MSNPVATEVKVVPPTADSATRAALASDVMSPAPLDKTSRMDSFGDRVMRLAANIVILRVTTVVGKVELTGGVDDLHHGIPQLPEGAERYEGGMLNFPSLYAMRESVRMILEIGPERIERRVLELAGMAADVFQ